MSFGVDTWAMGTLRTGRLASGVTLLAQACYRRLTTPRGTVRGGDGCDIYGLDLSEYVGHVGLTLAQASLPSQIRAELRKDDRIADVRVAITRDGVALVITIDVTPVDETEDFTLTLNVSDVGVSVLGVPS